MTAGVLTTEVPSPSSLYTHRVPCLSLCHPPFTHPSFVIHSPPPILYPPISIVYPSTTYHFLTH